MGKGSDRVELAFLTLLLKDGADSICGGVAIDHKWVFKSWLTKDRSCTNGIDKGLKGGFVLVLPMEFAALGAERNECVKGGGKEAEVPDVHAIKVKKTQEGM